MAVLEPNNDTASAMPDDDQLAPSDDAGVDEPAPTTLRRPHAVLRYTTLRIALFVIALLLLWLIPHSNVLVVFIGALLVSGLASYVLLAGQRVAMAEQLHSAQLTRRERAVARAAREDVEDDADDEVVDVDGEPVS